MSRLHPRPLTVQQQRQQQQRRHSAPQPLPCLDDGCDDLLFLTEIDENIPRPQRRSASDLSHAPSSITGRADKHRRSSRSGHLYACTWPRCKSAKQNHERRDRGAGGVAVVKSRATTTITTAVAAMPTPCVDVAATATAGAEEAEKEEENVDDDTQQCLSELSVTCAEVAAWTGAESEKENVPEPPFHDDTTSELRRDVMAGESLPHTPPPFSATVPMKWGEQQHRSTSDTSAHHDASRCPEEDVSVLTAYVAAEKAAQQQEHMEEATNASFISFLLRTPSHGVTTATTTAAATPATATEDRLLSPNVLMPSTMPLRYTTGGEVDPIRAPTTTTQPINVRAMETRLWWWGTSQQEGNQTPTSVRQQHLHLAQFVLPVCRTFFLHRTGPAPTRNVAPGEPPHHRPHARSVSVDVSVASSAASASLSFSNLELLFESSLPAQLPPAPTSALSTLWGSAGWQHRRAYTRLERAVQATPCFTSPLAFLNSVSHHHLHNSNPHRHHSDNNSSSGHPLHCRISSDRLRGGMADVVSSSSFCGMSSFCGDCSATTPTPRRGLWSPVQPPACGQLSPQCASAERVPARVGEVDELELMWQEEERMSAAALFAAQQMCVEDNNSIDVVRADVI